MIRCNQRPWLGLLAILCALGVFVLFPLTAGGAMRAVVAGSDPGGLEGDPIDSNDYGGGGGDDNHDDVENSFVVTPDWPGVDLGRWTVLLVPDTRLGVTVFSFVVIERGAIVGEARYAP